MCTLNPKNCTRDYIYCEIQDAVVSELSPIGILHHWWQECMGSSNTSTLLFGEEVHTSQFSQLMDFFDLLE